MEIALWALVFVVSIAVLVKASDFFIDLSEKIGLAFGIPQFVIGATIVAFGTSLPELVSSIVAVSKNSSEIVIGNVVGSNIANVLLILGLSALMFKKLTFSSKKMMKDVYIYIAGIVLLYFFIQNKFFESYEAYVFSGILALLTIYYATSQEPNEEQEDSSIKVSWKHFIGLALCGGFIYLGSEWTINSIIKISDILSISKELIALSAVALGTSLPELAVSISAVKRNNTGILIGNILGSCTFNIFCVVGISGLFGKLIIPESIFSFAFPAMVLSAGLFYLLMRLQKITPAMGGLFLALYMAFIYMTFV